MMTFGIALPAADVSGQQDPGLIVTDMAYTYNSTSPAS
jgi:hypothetical protein